MKEKILIALSDLNLASNISRVLSAAGYVPAMVLSGDDALEKMQSQKPALLVIDIILPGKNGYDVLAEKSLNRQITKIPVLVVSNSGMPIEMNRLPSTAGAVKGYVIKAHVEPDEVLEKIKYILGKSETEASVSASAETKKPPAGKKILWVEDDKFLSNILIKKFESSGYIVFRAKDSQEAFSILEGEVPDIIILDVLLPGMTGFEVLQQIKMKEKLRPIPVMMLSNMSKPSDIEKAKMLGAQKFLVKVAVSLDEIVKEVDILVTQ